MATRHVSYYVNLSTLAGVIGSVYVATRALALEEAKAGIEHKPLMDIVKEDVEKVRNWAGRTFSRTPKMYRHF